MAQSQADVRQQSAINAGITALAASQTAQLWPNVDWASPAAATAVRTLYGTIVGQFGQSAAAVASQFYDDQRLAAGVPGQYTASMADPLPPVMLDKIVTSAFLGGAEPADHTHAPEPASDQTTSDLPVDQMVPQRLDGALQRLVLQPGRETIAQNAAKDPAKARYVRVPTSAKPCAFCVMLASRELGPNFSSYSSAHNALFRSDGQKYHKNCDCEAVAVFPGTDAVDISPNIGDYGEMYAKATADAGTHRDTKKILASMRKLHGLR